MKIFIKSMIGLVIIYAILGTIYSVKDKLDDQGYSNMLDSMSKEYNMFISLIDESDEKIGMYGGIEYDTKRYKYLIKLVDEELIIPVYADEGRRWEHAYSILKDNGHEILEQPRIQIRSNYDISDDIDRSDFNSFLYWTGRTTNNNLYDVNFVDGVLKILE